MVFVHGGAFEFNAGVECSGGFLLEHDVVLVCVQYRLGPFGFLSTQSKDIPGNAGVQDILLALKWLQAYVHHFGGDPLQVTLFGHSAGACIVSALTLSSDTRRDLFHRAIIQSSSYFSPWAFNNKPVDDAREIGKLAGCNGTDTINNLNDCLRNINALTLLDAYTQHSVSNKRDIFFLFIIAPLILEFR